MRNALAYAGKGQCRIVSAWIGTAFAQDDAAAARKQWRKVADQARPRVPKLAALMDEAEADVLAYMGFAAQHRTKLHSPNPIERLTTRSSAAATSSGSSPTTRPPYPNHRRFAAGQNDEWAAQPARYMTLETIARSAMIPRSACHTWQPDRQFIPAQKRRSYTTRPGTILSL